MVAVSPYGVKRLTILMSTNDRHPVSVEYSLSLWEIRISCARGCRGVVVVVTVLYVVIALLLGTVSVGLSRVLNEWFDG